MSFLLGVSSRLSGRTWDPLYIFCSVRTNNKTRRVLFRNNNSLPLIGMGWSFEEQRGSPRACTVTITSDHQISSHQSSSLALGLSLFLLATPFGSAPHALGTVRSSISLFSYITTSLLVHTHSNHTRSTLHPTHPHGDTSLNPRTSTSTSPLIHLDERGCAAFSSRLNLIKPPSFSPWVSPPNTTRRLLSINSLSTLGSLGSAEQHKLSVYRHRRLSCSLDRHHIDR